MNILENAKEEIEKWYNAAIDSKRGPVDIDVKFSNTGYNKGDIIITLIGEGEIYHQNLDNNSIKELIPLLSKLFVRDEFLETMVEKNGSYLLNNECNGLNNTFIVSNADQAFIDYCKGEMNKAVSQLHNDNIKKSVEENRARLLEKFNFKKDNHELVLNDDAVKMIEPDIDKSAKMNRLIVSAEELANEIVEEAEEQTLIKLAQEQAKMLQDQYENDVIMESAQEQAKMLQNQYENDVIMESAQEEAMKIFEKEREEAPLFNIVHNFEDDEYNSKISYSDRFGELEDVAYRYIEENVRKGNKDNPYYPEVYWNDMNNKLLHVKIGDFEQETVPLTNAIEKFKDIDYFTDELNYLLINRADDFKFIDSSNEKELKAVGDAINWAEELQEKEFMNKQEKESNIITK